MEKKMLNIALTKGRLEEKTVELLEKAGIACGCLVDKGRKLVVEVDGVYRFIFAKACDVVTYVERGVSDIGVVGKDTLMEMKRPVNEIAALPFGKCRFALAVLKGKKFYSGYSLKTVATKYPEVTKEYFETKDYPIEIVKIEGSVELAPILNLADGIVDIVETGSTLRENGLEVIETVAEISARLISNPVSLKTKKEEILSFCRKISVNI
ncbi:MAG: ATP phosphoribosyltransferase [Clostridiales bacterium]|jgi:ATP phosphoribosyltransferase|nr:ATP phosphoribosyltransferase [Clostridiales bacterium]